VGVDVQLHAFSTLAVVGGKWSALSPGKELPVPPGQETVWTPEPVWTWRRRERKSHYYFLHGAGCYLKS